VAPTSLVYCRNCKHAIKADGQSGRVHYLSGYVCRDASGGLLSTHAEPPEPGPPSPPSPPRWPPRWPPLNRQRR
jgi:hypothetical protein